MSGWHREFGAGVLVIVSVALLLVMVGRSDDRPFRGAKGYKVDTVLDTAEGIIMGTPVEFVGVRVGSVLSVRAVDGDAELKLEMDAGTRIPNDSKIQVYSKGILGDAALRILPGEASTALADGDRIEEAPRGAGLAELQQEVAVIAADLKVVSKSLADLLGDEQVMGNVRSVVANMEEFSGDLTRIGQENRGDIREVVVSIRELSERLVGLVERLEPRVQGEMDSIEQATERLNAALVSVGSIADKVDSGQGTLGRLVNEDEALEELSAAVGEVRGAVERLGGMGEGLDVGVSVGADYFIPTARDAPAPMGGLKTAVTARLYARPDFWLELGIVDDPLGQVGFEERVVTDSDGAVVSRDTASLRRNRTQLSLLFVKRWKLFALRAGIMENGGGLGGELFFARDRLRLSLDVYDWNTAAWPKEGAAPPNLRFGLRVFPVRFLTLHAGLDNIVNGALDGRWYPFFGVGVDLRFSELRGKR